MIYHIRMNNINVLQPFQKWNDTQKCSFPHTIFKRQTAQDKLLICFNFLFLRKGSNSNFRVFLRSYLDGNHGDHLLISTHYIFPHPVMGAVLMVFTHCLAFFSTSTSYDNIKHIRQFNSANL